MPPNREPLTGLDQDTLVTTPTDPKTPIEAALEVISTSIASLALSSGSTLTFLKNSIETYISQYDTIKRKRVTMKRVDESTTFPRSLRFKFTLTVPDEIKLLPDFTKLEKGVEDSIRTCQVAIKNHIIKSRTLEIDYLEKQLSTTALEFLTLLAQTYFILKPEYKTAELTCAIKDAIKSDGLAIYFCHLDHDETTTIINARIVNPDLLLIDDSSIGVTASLCAQLITAFNSCILGPLTAYKNADTAVNTMLQLAALNTTTSVTKKTEAMSNMLDSEASVDPTLLNELIDKN